MTYAEVAAFNREAAEIAKLAREASEAIRGDHDERFYILQQQETRRYILGRGLDWAVRETFEVSVNPMGGIEGLAGTVMIEGSARSLSPTMFPSSVWRALAEVMAMLEDWRAGKVENLPPSGPWQEVSP